MSVTKKKLIGKGLFTQMNKQNFGEHGSQK